MKHLAGMLAAAAFLVLGITGAQALSVGVPPSIGPGGTTTMGANSYVIIGANPSAAGTDHYFVNAAANGALGVSLIDNPQPAFGISTVFDVVKLYDHTINAFVNAVVPPPPYPSGNSSFSLVFSGLLNTHNYELTVKYFTGAGGGLYGGTLLLTSVPLPASMLLLLTALGFLAFFAYRKRLNAVS